MLCLLSLLFCASVWNVFYICASIVANPFVCNPISTWFTCIFSLCYSRGGTVMAMSLFATRCFAATHVCICENRRNEWICMIVSTVKNIHLYAGFIEFVREISVHSISFKSILSPATAHYSYSSHHSMRTLFFKNLQKAQIRHKCDTTATLDLQNVEQRTEKGIQCRMRHSDHRIAKQKTIWIMAEQCQKT